MVLNPFKSSKWRHRSTTVEMRDEETTSSSPPPVPPKNNKVPFNSDSVLDGIGDYVFQSPIGGGKFSKVILATHYLTGEKVAIKIINKRAHMYRVMSRLVREITLMEVLDHENIVRLYETYETADALYIVMEYVEGYNLEEYLKTVDKGILQEHQARDIFRQVVKAIDHCHSKWIVHRDLKTPNILLTSNDHHVKIADFGLGNRFGLQRLNTVCGSMLYYSPEIISAKSYFGPEVDTWCLGIMLFRMTAGLELFSHAKTSSELKKYITSSHYKFPSHLSPELQNTIQKCLSMNRCDRLSLKSFLSTDPWFNNFGTLNNIFDDRIPNPFYNANEATEAYIESIQSEDSNRIKYSAQHSKLRCKQDLQEEKKRGLRVPKTVIYHIFNPSTYFTGPAPHSSLNPIDLEGQSQVIMELNENLLVTLKQNRLQPISLTDLKSPISQLFRKLKRTESQQQLRKTSSALNLSHLYQRVAKDQTTYYSMQCHVHTDSSTTVISGISNASTFVDKSRRLSHRFSMMFSSNTLPEEQRHPSEMIKVIRSVCEILGITYYQTTATQLVCLLTLRNCKKQQQQKVLSRFASSERLSNKGKSSFISSNTSTQSSVSNNWFSRQVNRFSGQQQQSNMVSSASTGFVLGNSSHDLLSMGRATQLQQDEDTKEDPEGFVLLSVDTFHVPSSKVNADGTPLQIVGTRYSKLKGSNKVFKLAKGWIQMLLSQNATTTAVRDINEKPIQQTYFDENSIIRL